jgi:putative ABC transport system ATP-binding protein
VSILKIDHIFYSYDGGKTPVLKDVTFDFEKGKTYAIVGKSGSGKTTLLSLMSGLEKVQKGRILYDEKDLSKIDHEEYRSKNIGVIFQSFNLLPHLTALENVVLSLDVANVKAANKKELATQMLQKVGLGPDKAGRRVLKLSGGEQQRVAIARALSYNPDIILADEPTGNLDGENENAVMQILKSLAVNDHKCVIIVTHSPIVADNVDKVFSLKPMSA